MTDMPVPDALPRRDHARRLLVLGLPLVGSTLASFAIHMTDTIMLGWYSVTALAAATVATSIWFVTFIVGAGFGNAVPAVVAQALASGDDTRARRITRMALWLSLVYSALAVVALWWGEALLLAIGQTADVSSEGQAYLRIAVWGMFPAMAGNALRGYLSANGLTAVQLWITLAAFVLNGLFNYALIFGNWGAPELGIRGAAIASVVIQIVQLVVIAAYVQWKLPQADLFARLWRPDREALGRVFRLGLPIGLTSFAEGGLFTASSVMMGWIGEVELAAHGIALQLTAFMFMFHVGMSQAATIRAGNAYGRHDEAGLRRGGAVAYAVAFGFGILVVALFLAFPGALVSLFLDPEEPRRAALLEIGVLLVMASALFQFVDSAQIVALSLLRGVQDTTVPMAMAIVSYWLIGMPASYVMAFTLGLGPVGLWLGLTVGLTLAAVSMGWRFWAQSSRIGA